MFMMNFCHSCAAPLDLPGMQGPVENYCSQCTDEDGNLKPYEEIHAGVVEWLKTWQPNLTDAKANERATHFLKAMPAWADK
jgi:hypothetical protein